MRKFKLLSFVLVLTLLVGAMSGCFGSSISKIYNTKKVDELMTAEARVLDTEEKLSVEGKCVGTIGTDIAVFESENASQQTLTFYSLSSRTTIASKSASVESVLDYEEMEVAESDYVFIVYIVSESDEEETYSFTIYDDKGATIRDFIGLDEEEAEEVYPTTNMDLLKIKDEYLRKNKEGYYATVATVKGDVIPEFTYKNGKYYYAYNEDSMTLFVFNEELKLARYLELPTHVDDVEWFVMNNGNVLIQYELKVLDTSDDYDYLVENENGSMQPVKLVSKIFNVKRDSLKEVDLDYRIARLVSRDTIVSGNYDYGYNDGAAKSLKNTGYIQEIKEERLVKDVYKYMAFNNKGEISENLDELFEGQEHGADGVPEIVAVDRYAYTNVLGQSFLLNGKGEVVGDISGYEHMSNKYIIIDDVIYDMNLLQVAECGNYEYYRRLGSAFVFTKTETTNSDTITKTYLFNNGQFTLIAEKASSKSYPQVSFSNGLIAVRGEKQTTYYNENNMELLSIDNHYANSVEVIENGLGDVVGLIITRAYQASVSDQTLRYEHYYIYSNVVEK